MAERTSWLELAALYRDLREGGWITDVEAAAWSRLPLDEQREKILARLPAPGPEASREESGMAETRIRRLDARRDRLAVAELYAREDSDRGFLARCLLAAYADDECICGEINARHCPVHNDPGPEAINPRNQAEPKATDGS